MPLMVQEKPDALLILGDTNSCLSAISAKRLHIPIFHMEAGNRCFDECLPEETNRRIVDHIADVNLCYSEHARRYLNAEGTAKERTYVTGSPMAEVLRANLAQIKASDVLARLGLEKGRYLLLSAHREENIDTEKEFHRPVHLHQPFGRNVRYAHLYSCHPRSRKFLQQRGFVLDKRVRLHEPLGFHDYNHLQMNAFCVVSDSGTLPEEASFFTSVGHPSPRCASAPLPSAPRRWTRLLHSGRHQPGRRGTGRADGRGHECKRRCGHSGALLCRGCIHQSGEDHSKLCGRCKQNGVAQGLKRAMRKTAAGRARQAQRRAAPPAARRQSTQRGDAEDGTAA